MGCVLVDDGFCNVEVESELYSRMTGGKWLDFVKIDTGL